MTMWQSLAIQKLLNLVAGGLKFEPTSDYRTDNLKLWQRSRFDGAARSFYPHYSYVRPRFASISPTIS